jgi:hypothetical protein
MVEGFGENVAPTAAIRAILNSYPFSIGLLREILQNSDDARATKQVRRSLLSPLPLSLLRLPRFLCSTDVHTVPISFTILILLPPKTRLCWPITMN